ncbi:hypothetical protein AAG906_020799 [Vitis piasezkii]
MELTALALRSAAQKLRPYFQAHPVIVLTDQPLRNILHKPDLTGRMLQWAIELSEFGIEFQPRLSMKGQVMADFVLEYSRRPSQHQESTNMRSFYPDWTSLGSIRLQARVYSDSLVVRHVRKEYEAKDARMARYLTKVRDTLQRFTEWTIEKIRRTENGRADALVGIAASSHQRSYSVAYTCANQPIAETSTCNTIEASQADDQEWTNNITEYLQTGTLPEDPKQAHKIRVQATRFTLIGGHLYKRSFTGPYLRCLSHSEAQYVLAELHEGVSMVFRAMGHGHSGTLPIAPPEEISLVATDYLINGWKLKHMLASKTKMSPNLYGKHHRHIGIPKPS